MAKTLISLANYFISGVGEFFGSHLDLVTTAIKSHPLASGIVGTTILLGLMNSVPVRKKVAAGLRWASAKLDGERV